jgi:hypothetical protein
MAFTASTAFLPRMWNNRNDDLQNIPGLYGSVSGTSFITADTDAGLCCFKGDHMVGGGYQMTIATNGAKDIYFCNQGDVQRVPFGVDKLFAVGVETLGLGAPAGDLCTYTKAIPGETYAFGPGNFSTIVTTTNKYATVSNGYLVGSSSAPSVAGTIYFELDAALGIDVFTEANYGAFSRYNLLCRKV